MHYAVLGFSHPILGLLTYGVYLLVQIIVTGKGIGDHTWQINGLIILASVSDFLAFNLRNIAF